MSIATIVISSYEHEKIRKAIAQFKKFTAQHKLKNPVNAKQPKKLAKIHGCDENDLKRKTIAITGPLETITNIHTVTVPKGVVLQFS